VSTPGADEVRALGMTVRASLGRAPIALPAE
jgi:hypothetical protein